ncbi:MAG: HAMP domain-containing protein, partial [Gaiellaceae bacterium]
MSLRARLLIVLAALAVVGLAIANVATYAALRSFLIQRVDRNVNASADALANSTAFRHAPDPGELQQLAVSTPGAYVGLRYPNGVLVWRSVGTRLYQTPPPRPHFTGHVPTGNESNLTVGAVRGSTRYRARIEPVPGYRGYFLIVAAPLSDVHDTLHRLVVIEVLASLGVLLGIVGLGLWLVRVGLAPLRRIEETAGAIAGGDLSRRIENTNERTEVGRLGVALNAMLHQIEGAFAERTASEQR